VWLRRKMLRGSIDEGESCCKDAELLPAPILDVRGEERNSNFGEWLLAIFFEYLWRTFMLAEGSYAYLRRTPRTLPWMLTLAAGA
jgi:hypothetical protein